MKKVLSLIVVATMLLISLQGVFAAPDNNGLAVGKLTAPSSRSAEEVAFGYLNANKGNLKFSDSAEVSFVVKNKTKDSFGSTVVTLQQLHKGVPVFGSMQKATVGTDGVLTAVSGTVVPDLDKKAFKAATVTAAQAITIAQAQLKLTPVYETAPTAELVVFNNAYTFLVNLNFLEPEPGNWYIFVDAATGSVVNEFNKFETVTGTNTVSTGTGVLGDTKTFNTTLSSGSYYLQDNTRGNGVWTYNSNNKQVQGTLYSNTTGVFNTATDKALVDAHYYAALTYDYYKNTFGRNSYNNAGAKLISSAHFGNRYNNAGWTGSQMIYGDGDGTTFISFSGGVDVIGHELTHAVTDSEAALVYQNESGAISEGLSDIFGTLVEYYSGLNPDWLMGEDIYTPSIPGDALRSMADPTLYGDPDYYPNRYTGTSDYGGVHTNSGILNKAGYLIANGGTSHGVTVTTGLGRDKLGAIFYRVIVNYLLANETFSQLRTHTIQAATDLYGAGSTEVTTVQQAFSAVGVN